MTPTNKDIKVLGRVVSVAVDSIVVDAEQVHDSIIGKDQATINSELRSGNFEQLHVDGTTKTDINGATGIVLSNTDSDTEIHIDYSQFVLSHGENKVIIDRNGINTVELDTDSIQVPIDPDNNIITHISASNGIFVDHKSNDGAVKIDNEGITVYPIGAYDNVKISDGKISIDSSYIDKEVIRLQSEEGSYINLNSTGSIMIADRLPSSVGRSETAITPFDVTTKKIVANSYIPVAKPVDGGGQFDPSLFNEPGRYYFLVQNTLNSGSPCKYGVFVDVLCQYDNNDGSLIGIHQTYTMPSGANTPGDTTADNLALKVYYTWDGSTWTTSEYPAGKTSFIA